MANRDQILRELIVEQIRAVIESDFVSVKSALRYSDAFDLSDPLSLITRQEAEYLIGTVGGIMDVPFSGSDIVPNSGNPYITLALTGSQRPFSVLVNGDVAGDGSGYKQSEGKLYIQKPDGSAWSCGDVINVVIFG